MAWAHLDNIRVVPHVVVGHLDVLVEVHVDVLEFKVQVPVLQMLSK